MPMQDNLTIGKGRLFFDQFEQNTLAGKGFRFLGNVPEINVSQDVEQMEHFSSTGGIRRKDRSVTTQRDMTLNFTTDNMSLENLAMWYGGSVLPDTQTAAASLTSTIVVQKGFFYQLGVTATRPDGLSNLGPTLTATKTGVAVDPALNFDFDAANGTVEILPNAPGVVDGDSLIFTYSTLAKTTRKIVDDKVKLFGTLMFLPDNPVGENFKRVWPYISLRADGDTSLIGDDWATISFICEVLNRDSATPKSIIRG